MDVFEFKWEITTGVGIVVIRETKFIVVIEIQFRSIYLSLVTLRIPVPSIYLAADLAVTKVVGLETGTIMISVDTNCTFADDKRDCVVAVPVSDASDLDAELDLDTDTDAELDIELDTKLDTEPDAEPDAESDAKSVAESDAEPERDIGANGIVGAAINTDTGVTVDATIPDAEADKVHLTTERATCCENCRDAESSKPINSSRSPKSPSHLIPFDGGASVPSISVFSISPTVTVVTQLSIGVRAVTISH